MEALCFSFTEVETRRDLCFSVTDGLLKHGGRGFVSVLQKGALFQCDRKGLCFSVTKRLLKHGGACFSMIDGLMKHGGALFQCGRWADLMKHGGACFSVT